jgi:GrpB-like predicted nucleotidyltransferase (UPF0157 family)
MILGLKRSTVELFDHDPQWETVAAETITRLKSVFGAIAVDIQHVGSTAIRSIKAKPIIDIAVGVRSFDDVTALIPILEAAGIMHHANEDWQRYFVIDDSESGLRTHNIHTVIYGGDRWKQYIRFRDYCNTHIAEAKEYENIKCRLAAENPIDPGREKYLAGKSEIVNQILRKAQ